MDDVQWFSGLRYSGVDMVSPEATPSATSASSAALSTRPTCTAPAQGLQVDPVDKLERHK